MIRVELTEDQAAIVLRALSRVEALVEARQPPNDYQEAMKKSRLAEIFNVSLAIIEARDASRAEAGEDPPATKETATETPPEPEHRLDMPYRMRPEEWIIRDGL